MSKGLNILQHVGGMLSGKPPAKPAAATPKAAPDVDDEVGGAEQSAMHHGNPVDHMADDHKMGQGEGFGINELEQHVAQLHAMIQKMKGGGGSRGEHG